MRRSLGTAVFSGMIGVTLFGIFLTPVFFYVIQGLGDMTFLTSERWQRIASSVAGGLLGLVFGFLLARIGIVSALWVRWSRLRGRLDRLHSARSSPSHAL